MGKTKPTKTKRAAGKTMHIMTVTEVADTVYPQALVDKRRDLFRLISTVSRGISWLEEVALLDKDMNARAKQRGRK